MLGAYLLQATMAAITVSQVVVAVRGGCVLWVILPSAILRRPDVRMSTRTCCVWCNCICAGTLHYMAPEVVKNPLKDHPDDFKNEQRYHYNMVVDSWAIGCLAYELLAGFPPFTANTQNQVVHNINNLAVQYPKRMSEDAISFIKGALERIPGERATTTELIKHPWIMQHMVSWCHAVINHQSGIVNHYKIRLATCAQRCKAEAGAEDS